jgi:hypothetical protein
MQTHSHSYPLFCLYLCVGVGEVGQLRRDHSAHFQCLCDVLADQNALRLVGDEPE